MIDSILQLRDVQESDLSIFFEQQLDPDATRMAAFPSRNREAFFKHWETKVLTNPENIVKTITVEQNVIGNVLSWNQSGQRLVGYWIGKEYWGKGYATQALLQLLSCIPNRPLHAHVVNHNLASIRVLEKCGFVTHDENGEEVILILK